MCSLYTIVLKHIVQHCTNNLDDTSTKYESINIPQVMSLTQISYKFTSTKNMHDLNGTYIKCTNKRSVQPTLVWCFLFLENLFFRLWLFMSETCFSSNCVPCCGDVFLF